jgi:hypothetical protein
VLPGLANPQLGDGWTSSREGFGSLCADLLMTVPCLAELENWVLNLTIANIKLSTYMDTGEGHDGSQHCLPMSLHAHALWVCLLYLYGTCMCGR